MKNRKLTWIGISIAVIIVGNLLFDLWRTTTFESAIDQLLAHDEEITEIDILHTRYMSEEQWELTISDRDDVNRFLEQPSKMKLKRTSNLDEPYSETYFLHIRTNVTSYLVTVEDTGGIIIGDSFYIVTGQNELLNLLELLKE